MKPATRTLRFQNLELQLDVVTANVFLKRLISVSAESTLRSRPAESVRILRELWNGDQLTVCERQAIRETVPWLVATH